MISIMDKNEVITLSSDDETETHQFEKSTPCIRIQPNTKNIIRVVRRNATNPKTIPQDTVKRKLNTALRAESEFTINFKIRKINCSNPTNKTPEVVDLVDCSDKSPNETKPVHEDCEKNGETVQNPANLDVIDIDAGEDEPNDSSPVETEFKPNLDEDKNLVSVQSNQELIKNEVKNCFVKIEKISGNAVWEMAQNPFECGASSKGSNQNLKEFTEFVELCGSLETIPNDRLRLTKKLMKRFGEADSSYIKSDEFKALIQKGKEKVNSKNLYLIAKNVTDELSFRKKIDIISAKPSEEDEISEVICESAKNVEVTQQNNNKQVKRTKFINKILKKLDKLGSKIRELEEEEVDLSDEEGSSYVQLQRYRERFCQIYNRLCEYTNAIPNAERVCNRKICFTESKYPAINRCIEVWLNKTKRFPDFPDIMKLLESQSSSLGLPSNRESLRRIAIEIFQQVGAMLQRRRKYDLWDSFSGFLDDQIDPAQSDPVLEKVLKENFETRIKKEQEIFQYYSEMQEKERLEPEEVPEEEANHSPTESGNEDEKEIEEIENDINKRLDVAITEDTKKKAKCEEYEDWDESKEVKIESEEHRNAQSEGQKETKNNFKNCKSLKWRSEKSDKVKSDSADSSTGPENEEREGENSLVIDETAQSSPGSRASSGKSKESDKSDSDLELVAVEVEKGGSWKNAPVSCRTPEKSGPGPKNCAKTGKDGESPAKYFDVEDRDENCKSSEAFDVRYCQIMANNVFEDLSETSKTREKRKVFRDLTNVSRLMELHGKGRNLLELFTPSFFHRSFREFEKSSWKRRLKGSYRTAGSRGQKCALSQEEKTGKNVNSNAGREESSGKDEKNNPDGGGDEREGFYSGHGGESQEDGGEDKNSKNGGTGDEVSENKPEEEEEEEEDKDEGEIESKMESGEHSEGNETVEVQEVNLKTEWPLDDLNNMKEAAEPGVDNTPVKDEGGGDEVEVQEKEEVILENNEGEVEKTRRSNSRGFSREKNKGKMDEKTEEIESPIVKPQLKAEETVEIDVPSVIRRVESKPPPKRIINDILNVEISVYGPHENVECRTCCRKKPNGSASVRKTRAEDSGRTGPSRNSPQAQPPGSRATRRSAASTADEERVKRFLLHSPSSISITPPRSLARSKPPSEAAMQALATLRNLKGISATIVKGKPKTEDDVMVIGGSYKGRDEQKNAKRRRSDLPVITNVQSIYSATPKIVTVQGNVSGFENPSPEVANREKSDCDSSSIRISNVWGNLPNNFMQAMEDAGSVTPGCSGSNAHQAVPQPCSVLKKRNTKKKVEYVVLD